MKLPSRIVQAVVGLLIGAGVGMVLGFIEFALIEKLYPSGGLTILAPSGALAVGILGAVLIGIAGIVVGLVTGALRLTIAQAAIAGILIFALIRGRAIYSDLHGLITTIWGYFHGERVIGRFVVMDLMGVALLLDFAIIGILVAVFLRQLFGNKPGPSGSIHVNRSSASV